MKKSISVYALGGAGINIVSPMIGQFQDRKDVPGHANLSFGLLDSSQANLPDSTHMDRFVLTAVPEHANGGGANRTKMIETGTEAVSRLFGIQPPGDLNIVIASAAGATGGYFQNLVTSMLMSKGHACVPVVLGKTENWKHARNTQLTMINYASMVEKHRRSLSIVYMNGQEHGGRDACDEEVRDYVRQLSVFFGGQCREMDLTDMVNMLQPENVLDWFEPSLLLLRASQSDNSSVNLIAAATLMAYAQTEPELGCGYHPVGILTPECAKALGDANMPMSQLFVYEGAMAKISCDIETDLRGLREKLTRPRAPKGMSLPTVGRSGFSGEGDLVL